MKARFLLSLSLAFNVLLATLVVRSVLFPTRQTEPTPEPAASQPSQTPPHTSRTATANPPEPATTTPQTPAPGPRRFTWEQVESPDYREYIANLRAIGCPEETIRDIITADVTKLYEAKRKTARGTPRKFEFWKPGNPVASMLGDPETLKALRALEEEKARVLRELGIDAPPANPILSAVGGDPMEMMFDFVSDSKRLEISKVMADHQTKVAETMRDGNPDGESVLRMQRDMEKALREKLTPEEFREYQLRFSITANTLRQQIAGFDPSEEEFLKVFELRSAFDETHSPFGMGNETEAEQRKRTEATEALNNSIRDALGPERYEDYRRAQDYGYQQIHQVARKAGLPTATANEVYAMKRTAEQQAAEIRANIELSREQRTAALQAIRAETETTMRQTLGDTAWDQYNRPNNTWWLRSIAPSPNSAPANITPQPTVVIPTP